jgi:hypothetical protein
MFHGIIFIQEQAPGVQVNFELLELCNIFIREMALGSRWKKIKKEPMYD